MAADLYREVILDHYRNPRNYGSIDPADYSAHEVNPLCGDEIEMDLKLEDGVVADVKFEGRGCAVSMASASILTEMVKGQPIEEVMALTKDDLLEELGIPVSPARMKCALLGLKALKVGIYGVPQDDL
jgi:nitrogen fixation protein NifU and related proteins